MIALLASQETVRFTLSNDAWSQLPDGPIEVTGIFLSPTDDVTDYWSLSSIGISQSNGGPAIYFDIWRAKNDGASFIDQFKRASTVVFSKGTVPIGKFDLSGSGAAMSALIDCRDFIRSDPNFDPFAH